jgi:uncharacterized phage-associated protein
MRYAKFDENKALAAILLVIRQLQAKAPEKRADLYKLLKVLYFADRKHLSKYNRTIAGDHYVAMADGPVPSRVYDMLKSIRGDGDYLSKSKAFAIKLADSIEFDTHKTIVPRSNPDLDELSETDVECLTEAIEEYKNFSFPQLKRASHDAAYDKADEDNCIAFEDIAAAGGADSRKIGFVQNWLENENFPAR